MNSNLSAEFVKLSRDMQSLVARLENQAHHTSRDMSSLRSHIVSIQSRVDCSLDVISKTLQVLQTAIFDTAAKMDLLQSMVKDLHKEREVLQEMKSLDDLLPEWNQEELAWMNSLFPIPEHGTIPDITCSETIFQQEGPRNDPTSTSGGFGVNQGWGSQEKPTGFFQRPTSKNPGPSGGPATCLKRK